MSANKVTVSPNTSTVTVSSAGTVGPQGGTGATGVNGTDGTHGYSAHVGSGAPANNLARSMIFFSTTKTTFYTKKLVLLLGPLKEATQLP